MPLPAPRAAQPVAIRRPTCSVTNSMPCCCKKSRAEGVTTLFAATTMLVAPAATASCTSRIAISLRSPRSMLFSPLFTSPPRKISGKISTASRLTVSTISARYASTGTGVGQKGFDASRPSVNATIWPVAAPSSSTAISALPPPWPFSARRFSIVTGSTILSVRP